MSWRDLDRRSLLKGLLAGSVVSIGLPPLECFLDVNGVAYAGGGALPTRFGLFFWGNGNLPDRWTPSGEGTEWALSEQLAPLAPLKHKLCVVSGMKVQVANTIPHHSGAAGFLSGMPALVEGDDHTYAGPTIDQIIAAAIGDTVFRSIECGAAAQSGLSYNGPHSRNPAESSPHVLFERVFGAGFTEPGDEPIVDPRVGLRRSVLDAVMDDIHRVRDRVGSADRQRLEQHLDGIRDLEVRLARMEEDPPNLEACTRPAEPATDFPDVDGRPQLAAKNRAFCDILAMALACDQTRVVSNYFTYPVNNTLFPGASAGHHNLTHDEPGDQPEVNAIVKQCVEQYAVMLAALDAVEEGDGTLLDHCAVLGTSDISFGRTHSLEEFPIVIGGSACEFLKQDFHYRSWSGENASKVMLSLTQAVGMNLGSFGAEEGFTDEGLVDILR